MDAKIKPSLRKLMRAKRAEMRKSLPDFAATIARAADTLPLPASAVVAGYVPIASEADPDRLMADLDARGHDLALPCIEAADSPLTFRRWREGDALEPGPYSTLQPKATAQAVRPDALLVPLLAYDKRGWRLGYGGGYYDRTLLALRRSGVVLAIGIAFADQEIAAMPVEETDQPLDMVLTERGLRRFD